MRQKQLYFLCGLLTLLLAACQRPKSEQTQIQLAVPQKMASNKLSTQSLSTDDLLAHLIINVTGEGISSPILYQWDSCHDCPVAMPIPTSFALEVPMGSNRLVQVLAVYSNHTTNSMKFYYGDVTQSLSKAEEALPISITQVGDGTSPIVSGRVSGRYFNTVSSGPTGEIYIKYNPNNGRPSLIVEKASIANGWFSFFMLSGASFEYQVVSTGELLWGGAVSLDSAPFLPVAGNYSSVARAAVPVHIREENQNGTPIFTQNEASYFVWGYWGSGSGASVATAKTVCTDFSTALTRLHKYSPTALSSQPVLTVSELTSSGTMPTVAQLLDQSGSGSAGSLAVKGGSLAGSAPCTSFTVADLYSNFLKVKASYLDGQGNDRASGFSGIFRLQASGNGVDINPLNSPRLIVGQLLPGIEAVTDELRFFKRIGSEDLHIDEPNCYEIAAGSMGFVFSGSAPVDAIGNFSLTTDISSSEAAAGVSGVLCPVKAGLMFRIGEYIQKYSFSSNGGGGAVPANSYQLQGVPFTVGFNQCQKATIELKDSGTNSFNVSNSVTLAFPMTFIGLTGAFYSDSSCSTASSTVSFNPSEVRKDLWYKVTTGSSGQINASSSGFGPPNVALQVNASSPGGLNHLGLTRDSVRFYSASDCEPVDIYMLDSTGTTAPAAASTTINLSVPATLGAYSSSSCTAGTEVTAFPIGGLFTTRFFVKRLSGSGEEIVTANYSAGGVTAATLFVDPLIIADHTQILTAYGLLPGATFGVSECIPLIARALDAANATPASTPGSRAISLQLGATSGLLYPSETACTSGVGGASNMSATIVGSFWDSSVFWLRNASGGATSVNVTNSSYRLQNPFNSFGYNTSVLASDLSTISGAPYGWFRMNELLSTATSSPVSSWLNHVGSMPSFSPAISAPFMTNVGGPWRSVGFSGTTDLTANSISLGPTFSFSFRVRFSSVGTNEGVLQIIGSTCSGTSAPLACKFERLSDGSLSFLGVTSSPGVISDTNWHTISLHRTSIPTVKVFLDGSLILSSSIAGAYTDSFSVAAIRLGYTTIDGGTTKLPFNGNLGDLAVWISDTSSNEAAIQTYLMNKNP